MRPTRTLARRFRLIKLRDDRPRHFPAIPIAAIPVIAFPVIAFPVIAFPVIAFPVIAFPVIAFPVIPFPSSRSRHPVPVIPFPSSRSRHPVPVIPAKAGIHWLLLLRVDGKNQGQNGSRPSPG
jgi:hypothetical protein